MTASGDQTGRSSYERAYKVVVATAGKIPGLKGRWLAHADDDPDAGYTISLWENDAAMRTYESGEVLQNTISAAAEAVFLWRLHHNPLRNTVRGGI